MQSHSQNLISSTDLSDDDLAALASRGAEIALGSANRTALAGAVVGIYFKKTSTRTRTAFSSGALRLGADILTFGPDDLQTSTGETVADTGRVLSGMLDVLVARTAESYSQMKEIGSHDGMSVINAMSAEEHPTQAMADLTTMVQAFGTLEGRRVLYLGEGNNSAASLTLALSRFRNVELELRTPPGFGLTVDVIERAQKDAADHAASVIERHDMDDLPKDVDVIYTTRWETTGTAKKDPDWKQKFRPFAVDRSLWVDSPRAVFMHDLPAHRGEEVSGEVLDGPASIAFQQAVNKMYSAMSVLEWCRN